MSLNWNVKDVKFEKLWLPGVKDAMGNVTYVGAPADAEKYLNPVVNTLIWAAMTIGLGSITEKNVGVWAERIRAIEKVSGPLLCFSKSITPEALAVYGLKEQPEQFPLDILNACIGLSTNVTNETDATFRKRIANIVMDEVKRKLRK